MERVIPAVFSLVCEVSPHRLEQKARLPPTRTSTPSLDHLGGQQVVGPGRSVRGKSEFAPHAPSFSAGEGKPQPAAVRSLAPRPRLAARTPPALALKLRPAAWRTRCVLDAPRLIDLPSPDYWFPSPAHLVRRLKYAEEVKKKIASSRRSSLCLDGT